MDEKLKLINRELSRIKKEVDVKAIIAVGSAKDMILKAQGHTKEKDVKEKEKETREDVIDFASREKDKGKAKSIKDIDLFIITSEDESKQLRQVKLVEELEFDLNYFPEKVVKQMIRRKVQFFLEDIHSGRIVFDPQGVADKYIKMASQIYDSVPPEPGKGNLTYLKYNLQSKLDSIMRLDRLDEDVELEFIFLANLWIKNLLVYYFKIKRLWVPKDKRILIALKEQDELLYEKVKSFYSKKDPELLKDIARHVFYDDGVKLGNEMRFRFKF